MSSPTLQEFFSDPSKVNAMIYFTALGVGIYGMAYLDGLGKDFEKRRALREDLQSTEEQIEFRAHLNEAMHLDNSLLKEDKTYFAKLAALGNDLYRKLRDNYTPQVQETIGGFFLRPALNRCYSSLKTLEMQLKRANPDWHGFQA
jgi:hypothetical protein